MTNLDIKQLVETLKLHSNNLSGIIEIESNNENYIISPNNKLDGLNFNEHSQFYIGSLTKQITASLLLLTLNEIYNGNLNSIENALHIPISQLELSNGKFGNSILLESEWAKNETLHNLLTHTSGISDYVDQLQFELISPIDHWDIISGISYNYEHNQEYSYSNTNYLIIAKIIESMSNKTFTEQFNAKIKNKIVLDDTYNIDSGNSNHIITQTEFSALMLPKDIKDHFNIDMYNTLGTGSIISSPHDLLKWNNALFHSQILNNELLELLITDYLQDEDGDFVNYGLSHIKSQNNEMYGFNGELDQFNSFLCYLPDDDLSIVYMSNNPDDFESIISIISDYL